MKKIFTIKGMHCASCAVNIEKAIARLSGVEKVNVNFASEKAAIDHNEKLDMKRVRDAVEKLGYGLVDEGSSRIEFKVLGMQSDHCSSLIEKELMKTKGVVDAKVSFNNSSAAVEYDA
ncbi:MAG: heavy metal-associated domain-containing protein, partial [Nanoarchaeota archaeon]